MATTYTGNMTFKVNLLPFSNNNGAIGSSTQKWNEIYADGFYGTLRSLGRNNNLLIPSADAGTTSATLVPNAGLSMYEYYAASETGAPTNYGNLITIRGGTSSGATQIAFPWGGSATNYAPYIRTHSDWSTEHTWSAWKQLVFTDGTVANATNADMVDNYHASGLWRSDGATWNSGANVTCAGTGEWSFDINDTNATPGAAYWHVWSTNLGASILQCYPANRHVFVPVHLAVGGYNNTSYSLSTNSFICNSWIRTKGATGWYNEDYGGGWYMSDTTYIRNYGSKQLYLNAQVNVDATLRLWTSSRQITKDGLSVAWVNGRNSAIIRETSAPGWHAAVSVKTTGGSWDIGEYNASGWNNYLIFSYVTDSDYNAGNNNSVRIRFRNSGVVESAMWNDYAECRNSLCTEPGRVVYELGDDRVNKTNKRLMPFAGVVSDTYGYIEGETEDAHTPLAVAGRVLVYPYQPKENYRPGDCVCAAPNGTVDIMTREEIYKYPDRIVGTVSCVPKYTEWGQTSVKVNGRIWIKVK